MSPRSINGCSLETLHFAIMKSIIFLSSYICDRDGMTGWFNPFVYSKSFQEKYHINENSCPLLCNTWLFKVRAQGNLILSNSFLFFLLPPPPSATHGNPTFILPSFFVFYFASHANSRISFRSSPLFSFSATHANHLCNSRKPIFLLLGFWNPLLIDSLSSNRALECSQGRK